MKEYPLIFNGEMVRAILAGKKTQDRRPLKPQPEGADYWSWYDNAFYPNKSGAIPPLIKPPYGVGDRIWVRETFLQPLASHQTPFGELEAYWTGTKADIRYCADGATPEWVRPGQYGSEWRAKRPSIHMPRWAARLFLLVKGVRIEQVQDITEEDVESEGVKYHSTVGEVRLWTNGGNTFCTAKEAYQELWNSIYGKTDFRWTANPWVIVTEFEVVE